MSGSGKATAAAVEVALLGFPTVERAGAEAAGARLGPRAAVLLARLALASGGEAGREELADALWGERLPASWRGSLRNVVSELRRLLASVGAAGVLDTVGEGYRLVLPPGSRVDVLALEQDARAAQAALQAGDGAGAWERLSPWLEMSGRPVLPGARSEWVAGLRARVESVREQLLVCAGRAALELGEAGEAERLARRAIELAPWLEDAHRVLIGALIARGNRGAALAAYGRLRELLARELGVEPSEPTAQLYQQLLADAPSAPVNLGSAAIGEWRRSADYGLDVARRAISAGEYPDVLAIVNRTLEALYAAGDPDPVRRLDLLILLGAAQRALGDHTGFSTLERAVATARELGDGSRLADAVLAFTHGGAASDEHYIDHTLTGLYEEALKAVPEADHQRRGRLLGHLAVADAFERGGPRVRHATEQALELVRQEADEQTLLATLVLVRRAIWGHFQLDLQERLEQEVLKLATRLDEPSVQATGLLWRFMTQIEQGRGGQLEAVLEQAGEIVAGLRMGHYHHTLAYSHAALAILRGHFAEAEWLIERAAEIGRGRGVADYITEALRVAQLTGLRHEQGRLVEIRQRAVGLYAGAEQRLWLGMVAFIEAETGHPAAATGPLHEFLHAYHSRGPTLLAPAGLAAYTSYAIRRTANRPAAQELYELIAPHAGRGAYFAYFAGPIDLHLAHLAHTLGRPHDADRHLTDATNFCQALGAPNWTKRCQKLAAHP